MMMLKVLDGRQLAQWISLQSNGLEDWEEKMRTRVKEVLFEMAIWCRHKGGCQKIGKMQKDRKAVKPASEMAIAVLYK
jgi:hypothetical protein